MKLKQGDCPGFIPGFCVYVDTKLPALFQQKLVWFAPVKTNLIGMPETKISFVSTFLPTIKPTGNNGDRLRASIVNAIPKRPTGQPDDTVNAIPA